MEEDDNWSLMAIVIESARKIKSVDLRQEVVSTTRTTTTTRTTAATTQHDLLDEINKFYLSNPIPPYQFDASNNNINPSQTTIFYGHQIGASSNNSFQNSLCSNQIGSGWSLNANPVQNFSYPSGQTGFTSNHSFQNSQFSYQIGANNNNNNNNPFQNLLGLLFPDDQQFGTLPPPPVTVSATGIRGNVCNHHLFLESYQNFSTIPPQIMDPNPCYPPNNNPAAVSTPLHDYKDVSASANNNLVFRNGLRQLPPPEEFYLKPKRGLHKTPITVYHYRRKKLEKRRVHRLRKEELTTFEKWAWRKYGQKPIKGSPYPRNYYKCSSMKSCMARKHVERCPSEPGIYIVTYTGTHDHPMPTYRNHIGPRPKRHVWGAIYDPPPLEIGSPTSTMATNLSVDPFGSRSRSGSGSRKNDMDLDVNGIGEGSGGDEGIDNAGRYGSDPDENLGAQGSDETSCLWNDGMIEVEFPF